jgi:hypothetical protein
MLPSIAAKQEDCFDNYIKKTFERISKVKNLVPFADKKFVMINGKKCKNIFYHQKEFAE